MSAKNKPIPRTDREAIRAERAAGKTLAEIGVARGLSRQRVFQILTRPDPPVDWRGCGPRSSTVAMRAEHEDEILKLYRAGATLHEVIASTGVSMALVRRILLDADAMRGRGRPRRG